MLVCSLLGMKKGLLFALGMSITSIVSAKAPYEFKPSKTNVATYISEPKVEVTKTTYKLSKNVS